jgi:transposase
VYLARDPVDMRKGIDGLAALVRTQCQGDVFSGHLFVFRGRRAHLLKILFFDRGGFVLYVKRLERGRFHWPVVAASQSTISLEGSELAMLLDGIELAGIRRPSHWAPPPRHQAA